MKFTKGTALPPLLIFTSVLVVPACFRSAREIGPHAIDFPELTDIAQRYGLPAPPAEAPLVLANTGWTTLVGFSSTSHDPGLYQPAFLLEALPEGRARLLMGWEERAVNSDAEFRPATRPYSLAPPEKKLRGYALALGNLKAFATAVQLSRRGDLESARWLWEQILREPYFHDENTREELATFTAEPRLLLGLALYQYFYDATLRDGVDLKGLHEKLVQLRAEFPRLFSDDPTSYFPHCRTRFVRDLGRTLRAEKAPEGSVEALLIEYGNDPSCSPGQFHDYTGECDRPARDIFSRGLRAVPDLARLTGDSRLTHLTEPSMGLPADRLRLGQLAAALLAELTGSRGPAEAAAIDDRPESEIDFFTRAAVEWKDNRIAKFHEVPLWILGEKSPKSLLDLCSWIPARSSGEASLFEFTTAIVRSRLTPVEKSQALGGLAERLHGDPRLRAALQPLAEIDGRKCSALLLPILARFPKDVDGPYWTCEAAGWTHVVMQLEDDQVWRAYLKAARSAAVGLRMEMMNPMCYDYIKNKNRQRRLGFLGAFLDDMTVRDPALNSPQYEGPCAAFTFEKIEVRDFASWQIEMILQLNERPTEFWTAEDWSRLRGRVREALAKETLPVWAQ